MTPKFYTDYEGGNWKRWPADVQWNDSFTELRLPFGSVIYPQRYEDDRSIPWGQCILIGRLRVHSIAFDHSLRGADHFQRWDCIGGFTKREYVGEKGIGYVEENQNEEQREIAVL